VTQFGRWAVAVVVTLVAFALPAWISGAFVLESLLKDSGARWGVAASLGAACGALAAAWGYGFVTGTSSTPTVTGERSVAIQGKNQGAITTGDANVPSPPSGTAAPAPGSRSIAIGGDNTGDLSTGDRA
jgi:hypothetical protein